MDVDAEIRALLEENERRIRAVLLRAHVSRPVGPVARTHAKTMLGPHPGLRRAAM